MDLGYLERLGESSRESEGLTLSTADDWTTVTAAVTLHGSATLTSDVPADASRAAVDPPAVAPDAQHTDTMEPSMPTDLRAHDTGISGSGEPGTPRVHALLVGINEYANVTPLHGCVADISSIEKVLVSRLGDALNLRLLTDAQASRAGIIDGFRQHLTQGRAGDVALFYFCGHGSQEPCPPEWKGLEPSGMNQTLVPVDARANGVYDIADKELVALIQEVADTGAQVVTIFDSCHSGGVTRDVDDDALTDSMSRMTPALTTTTRTIADYLEAAVTLHDPARVAQHGAPTPSHIAIAACQHFETAKESPRQPPRRGTFTQALEEVLTALGPSATYIDLLRSVRAKVLTRAADQVPLLTVSGEANGATLFMGGLAGRRDLTIDIDDDGLIWLSAGTTDGIGEPTEGATTEIAIHRRGALDDPAALPVPIATARVIEAHVDRSLLQLAGTATLDPAQAYIGVITRLATPQLTVSVSGSPQPVVGIVRDALRRRSGLYVVASASTPDIPSVTAQVSAEATTLLDTAGVPLRNQRFAHDSDGTRALIGAVVHLAKWYGTRDRTPVSSTLNGGVKIDVLPAAEGETLVPDDRQALPEVQGVVEVKYPTPNGARAKFRLRNTLPYRVYVVLVDLSESFGCSVWFNDWIPAGDTAVAAGGKILRLKVPSWKGDDVTEGTDILKVFAAVSPIEAGELVLESLLNPKEGGAFRDIEEDQTQDSSFWGTTSLRLMTRK